MKHLAFKLPRTGVEVLAARHDWPLTYANRTQAERKAKSVGGAVYQSYLSQRNFYVLPPEAAS
jgi:hypothetical protein